MAFKCESRSPVFKLINVKNLKNKEDLRFIRQQIELWVVMTRLRDLVMILMKEKTHGDGLLDNEKNLPEQCNFYWLENYFRLKKKISFANPMDKTT